MMYPFLTLDDKTEIVHSEMNSDGKVKVYIEKPDADLCFRHAICYIQITIGKISMDFLIMKLRNIRK